ncbi:MAG: hypothetical protein HOY71_50960 [Nonomuraea sp.]|nr:hypothetical protein [Nonomuraea sp.]
MNLVESSAQRHLPARTNAVLAPLRMARPTAPTQLAIAYQTMTTYQTSFTFVTILGSGTASAYLSASGAHDLADLGFADLAALRRNLLSS